MRTNLLDDQTSAGYDGDRVSSFSLSSSSSDDGTLKKYFSTAPAPISRRTLTLLLIALSVLSVILLSLAISLAREDSQAPSPSPSPPLFSSSAAPSPMSSSAAPIPPPYTFFASDVGVPDLWRHLNSLQAIADANNGTRAIGGPGFNATVDYIYNLLTTQTHFDLMQQTFLDYAWFLTEPHVAWGIPTNHIRQVYQIAYHVMLYSGSVHVRNASLIQVNGGCSDANFANFPPGAVAFSLATSACSNAARATQAARFGAKALIAYQLPTVRNFFPGSVSTNTPIGAFLLTYTVGATLAELIDSRQPGGVTVDLNVTTNEGLVGVTNTCATSKFGDPTRTIISGSHCDSVPAGAGVNDNGSGTSLNLALALALNARENDPSFVPFRNRVRFCWWAAEEVGLHGSQEYVRRAKVEGLKGDAGVVGERIPQDIQANLNYDIVGSPNFVFGVWDGTTFTGINPNNNISRSVNGSLATTRLYERYFNNSGLTYSYRPLDNRSDYKSFHDAGIAAGGATSGREDAKTLEERNRYARVLGPGHGGIPHVNYDPCYHQRCDQVWGVNPQAILNLTHAAGFVLEELARMEGLIQFLQYPPVKTEWSEEEKVEEMRVLEANFAASTKAFLQDRSQ